MRKATQTDPKKRGEFSFQKSSPIKCWAQVPKKNLGGLPIFSFYSMWGVDCFIDPFAVAILWLRRQEASVRISDRGGKWVISNTVAGWVSIRWPSVVARVEEMSHWRWRVFLSNPSTQSSRWPKGKSITLIRDYELEADLLSVRDNFRVS